MVKRFDRRVLFVRPDLFVVYAETDATERARILAVASVGQGEDLPAVDCEIRGDRVEITSDRFTGEARIGEGPASVIGTVDGTDSIDRP